MLSTAHQGSA